MHRTLVAIVALALLAAACGGDGDDALESADGQAESSTDSGQDDAGQDDAGQDDAGAGDEGDPASGDADSEWCVAARSAADSGTNPLDLEIDPLSLDSGELQTRFTENVAVLEEWEGRAPPEIADDVAGLAETFRTLVTLADAAEWDLVTLATDPSFFALFSSEDLQGSADNVARYTSDVCGVDLAS